MNPLDPPIPNSPGPHLLRLPESKLYKSDARSRVWLVEHGSQKWVVKRFEFSPLRQLFGLILGLHPAQRERRRARQLIEKNIPVVPIAAHGVEFHALGAKAWLITPWRGSELLHILRDSRLADRPRRLALATPLAKLLADMLRLGVVNRDLKTSNILIDDAGRPWLIDVGAVRFATPAAAACVNLPALNRAAQADGLSRLDRLRFLRLLATRLSSSKSATDPALGDWRTLARAEKRQ